MQIQYLRTCILILCSAMCHEAISQNWQPFQYDRSSYWSQEVDGKILMESILIEEAPYQGPSLGYFNSVPCTEWDLEELMDFYRYNGDIVNYDKPAWVWMSGENVSINAYDHAASEWWALDFQPYVAVGTSWETQGLTIQCDSSYVGDVLGVQDSIKIFRCTTPPYDTIEFILSKSFGFTQYPPLLNFYDDQLNDSRPYFTLIGSRDSTAEYGIVQPYFSDYFHLEKDDILVWRNTITKSTSDTTYYIDTIQERWVSAEHTIGYNTQRGVYNKDWQYVGGGGTQLEYHFEQEGHILNSPTSWITRPGDVSFLHTISQMELIFENGDTIFKTHTHNTAKDMDSENCEIGFWFDLWTEETFSTKAGLTRQLSGGLGGLYIVELIGTVIDGVRDGITELPSATRRPKANQIQIFPNPFVDEIRIASNSLQPEAITVYNIEGQIVLDEVSQSSTIDMSGLPAGLYTIVVSDRQRNQYLARGCKL